MANLNKVLLIGRLTRDPEIKTFANGGKVAAFGFAVSNRKKNSSGVWDDEPVFLDCDAFDREHGAKAASLIEQYLQKGGLAFIEGHLKLDQWNAQDGSRRSKLKVVVDNVQFLSGKSDGAKREASPPAQQTQHDWPESESSGEIPF